jgi:RimJ/RimL family protein N-acetyltransferase
MTETEDPLAVGWGFTGEPPDAAAFPERAARAGLDWLVGAIARLAIVDVGSGATAGFVDLRRVGPPQVGGVGYTVHPSFRGRGITARSLRLLTAWAFGAGRFARLELGAKAGNVASQRAAVSGGFEPDGVRQRRLRNPDGSFSDEMRFALVNPRWR